jgi:hypothetical protein
MSTAIVAQGGGTGSHGFCPSLAGRYLQSNGLAESPNFKLGHYRIVIDKATYGVPSATDQRQILDLSKEIQQMVNEGKTCFQVRSLIQFKGDPAFGVVKTLTVEYHIDGTVDKKSATDPDFIDLTN